MFEKLLSLLPYQPGLVHQMGFYSQRMREETAIRRTGLVFIILAFFIQFFAVLSPPQSTIANSSNDIINGGFSTAAEGRAHCISDTQGFQRILHYYGISCRAFDNTELVTINASARNYFSVGRNPSQAADTPVNIPGQGNKVYWRDLSAAWGRGSYDTYRLTNQSGKHFYVIKDCANLVSVGLPSPSPLVTSGQGDGGVFEPAPTPAPTVPPPAPQPQVPQQPGPLETPRPGPTLETETPPETEDVPPPTPCPHNPSFPANSPFCYEPCEYNPLLPADSPDCKPCDKSVSSADTLACIDVSKAAINQTQGNIDANDRLANAGDVIIYTLSAKNKGQATVKGFTFQENLNDVLDYADIVDLHGGTLGGDKVAVWPAQDIKPGETATRQITVKVKNPIPQTPASSSDPMHFDLIMTNVYGNAVNIKLPGSPAKQVEVAAAKLPNAGPGETLAAVAAVVIIAGYFFGRARLLSRESELAIKETIV